MTQESYYFSAINTCNYFCYFLSSFFSRKSQGLEELEVADESPDVEKGVKLGFVSPGACVARETLTVSRRIIAVS